jgi:threonine/homoserine efflux transporter RhtA
MVIKRLGVVSVAKMYGAMGVLVGLLIGICFAALSTLFGSQLSGDSSGVAAWGSGMGLAAIVVMPIVYGVFTFISGLIGGWLYNMLAGMVGGVEIETS